MGANMATARQRPSSEPATVQFLRPTEAAHCALGRIVGRAQASVVEEAGEPGPALSSKNDTAKAIHYSLKRDTGAVAL